MGASLFGAWNLRVCSYLISSRPIRFHLTSCSRSSSWPGRSVGTIQIGLDFGSFICIISIGLETGELALITGEWPDQAALLEQLLDQWIEANPPGRGDGWHSYTLSLRTRNWIWLFRTCPQLATSSRIQSLWQQLLWLQAHPEYCHGGNHWLENLTALALGGLQFAGPDAQAMHNRSMRLLQKELFCKFLPMVAMKSAASATTYSCLIASLSLVAHSL